MVARYWKRQVPTRVPLRKIAKGVTCVTFIEWTIEHDKTKKRKKCQMCQILALYG
ncbi:hypothetical protein KL86DYS1_30093 [uncultured Dysgonomonas sp.]|uniref:Transposase n=1 Tax=uncultured Dysgonomonas sp. TaxID=206096 RepID=A0A212JQT9_9BACT|nr:hypothetical protein KL86DYS1_30093 [uncultured Dysgonomonas sp.]